MLEKTEGIVLSSIKYGDTSLITRIFTKKHGLLTFMVKGARSSKYGKGNLLQPLTILDLDLYFREQKNLLSLKEFNPQVIFNALHFDFKRKCIAIFMVEVLLKCCHEKQANEELYDFTKNGLNYLDRKEPISVFFPIHYLFEISMTLGFFPNICAGDYFDLQAGEFTHQPNFTMSLLMKEDTIVWRKGIEQFLNGKSDETALLNNVERKIVLDKMLVYFMLHVPSFSMPTSHEILREILAV